MTSIINRGNAPIRRGHMIKEIIKTVLRMLGIGIHRLHGKYVEDGLITVHSDIFREEPRFLQAYARGVQSSRGFDPHFRWRVHTALWAAQTSLRVSGDFVECGVNAGFMSSAI